MHEKPLEKQKTHEKYFGSNLEGIYEQFLDI